MNPEQMAAQNIDNNRRQRLELSISMKNAHEKARKEILSNPDYSIQEIQFASIYGQAAVHADIREAARLEAEFNKKMTQPEKNAKLISDVFEAIVLMHSEMSEWFGNAQTLKTSRYDDYINKVDLIAEWFSPDDGSRLLALAVDITYSGHVSHKLKEIKNEIDEGKLRSIRYFKDARGDFMGTRNNVPRVVIGASVSVVEEISNLWLRGENKQLATHPIQRVLIEQIATQLEAMHGYAETRGTANAATAYQQALGVIRPLRSMKAGIPLGNLRDDPVAERLKDETRDLFPGKQG